MTNQNNATLLAAFGIGMDLSSEDMCNIITDVRDSLPDNAPVSPLDDVSGATKDMDARALFIGAVLYGFLLDAYDNIDVSSILDDNNRKT